VDLNLKSASEEDYSYAKKIHHRSYRNMVVRQFGEWDDDVQDSFFDRTWERLPHTIILAENEPVGYCCIQEEGSVLWIRELVICPEQQGHGIGTSLLEKFIQRGKNNRISVQLNVMRSNEGAKRLYEKLGFRIYGENETHFFLKYKNL